MSTHYFQEILQYCQSHDRFYSDRGCFTSILNPKHYGCYKNKETIMYKNQLRDRLILQWMKMNQSKGLLYQSICIKPIIQIIGGYADWYDIYWPPDLHRTPSFSPTDEEQNDTDTDKLDIEKNSDLIVLLL